MSSQVDSGVQPSVRFSRVLGLRSVVALGASISAGMGVYVLLGLFVQVAGRQAVGAPYLFVAVLALVVIALVLYGIVMLLEMWLLRWRG